MVTAAMLAAGIPSVACGCAAGPRHAELRHGNGALAQSGPLVDGLQHGEWTFFYPDGARKAQGHYERDVRTGTWTHWYENGRLRMRGAYHGERQQGLWEFWFDDGSPQCSGEYRDGQEHGEWTFWHRGGALQQRGVFWRGHRELRWTAYDAAGRLVDEGSWLRDQQVGRWRRVVADGRVATVVYPLPTAVEPVLECWDDGSVRREGFRCGGVPDGVWVTRHRGGALRAIVEFSAGQPAGELQCRCEDGSPLARGPLVGNCPQGEWRVRSGGGEKTILAAREAQAPWDGRWSDAAIVGQEAPFAVAARWLAELRAPTEPVPVSAPPTGPPPAPVDPVPERLEAPTDPGEWTVRERDILELLRRYYRDHWLPRHHSLGGFYGAPPDAPRLGNGDPGLAAAITGRALPVTKFPTAGGELFDLASLRGKRVLFVVLRGFTSQVCISCFTQTLELAPLADRWAELDCEVVVLYPGTRSKLQAFVAACAQESPPYRMVYDPDNDLARALGLQGNLARPAAFAIDRLGVVRRAYIAESEQNIADRPCAQELLRWIERLP